MVMLQLRQLVVYPGQCVKRSQTAGRSQTLKAFRQWVRALGSSVSE
jgi:hypothetical protein